MGRFARGFDIHMQERRREWRDGDIPVEPAFERHLLASGCGVGDSKDDDNGQRDGDLAAEMKRIMESLHWSALEWRDIVPGADHSPGRCRAGGELAWR